MADIEDSVLLLGLDGQALETMRTVLGPTGIHLMVAESESDLDEDNPADVVISGGSAEAVERRVKYFSATGLPVPVLVYAPVESTDSLLEFMRAGVADILPEPLADAAILHRALRIQIEKVRLLRQNQQYRQELELANKELRVNLEELQADQRAGRQVQMRMLPENEMDINGIACAYCIQPSLYLSGDFFEYYRLNEAQIGFYFADVSGHGASSAFVTVLLRNLGNRLKRNLRRGSSDDLLYPDRFVQRVNTELLETAIGKHLTLFAGIIDIEQMELRFSIGAQFPMPILTQAGDSRFLEGKGPPVGLFPKAEFPVYVEALEPGFTLTICSDGILEVINAPSIAEKEDALLESVARSEHTIRDLERTFGLRWIKELPDDIAIVTLSDERAKQA